MFSLLLVLWARQPGCSATEMDVVCSLKKFQPGRPGCMQFKKQNQNGGTFATIVRLCRIVSTLLLTLQWKNIPVKNYTISATVVGIAKLFCQKLFHPGHPGGWIVIWKNFHPHYRDLGRKVRDFGNRGSPASHLKQLIFFFRRKERWGEISEIEPAQSTGLTWRGPLLRTPERVRVQKPWRSVQSTLAYNNLFANFSTLS